MDCRFRGNVPASPDRSSDRAETATAIAAGGLRWNLRPFGAPLRPRSGAWRETGGSHAAGSIPPGASGPCAQFDDTLQPAWPTQLAHMDAERAFIGCVAYVARYVLWTPETHGAFPRAFRAMARALVLCHGSSRRSAAGSCAGDSSTASACTDEARPASPASFATVPRECVDLVLSFCRWDWPADCAGDRGAGFTAALAEGEDVEQGVGAALGIRDTNLAGALTIESTVWQYMRMSLADCSALLETITAQREEYLVQRDNASSDELLFPWLLLNMVIELRSSETEHDEAPRADNAVMQVSGKNTTHAALRGHGRGRGLKFRGLRALFAFRHQHDRGQIHVNKSGGRDAPQRTVGFDSDPIKKHYSLLWQKLFHPIWTFGIFFEAFVLGSMCLDGGKVAT